MPDNTTTNRRSSEQLEMLPTANDSLTAGGMSTGSPIETKSRFLKLVLRYVTKQLRLLFVIAYLVYLGFALRFNASGSVFLCIITPVVLATQLNTLSQGRLSKLASRLSRTVRQKIAPRRRAKVWLRRILTVVCLVAVLVFLIVDNLGNAEKWIPLGGMAVFILIGVCFSQQRKKIDWVPVTWGILLQFGLGLVILRWQTGYHACQWVGDQVTTFLNYTDRGSQFAFGEKYTDHPIVFKVLPVVIFFSAMSSVLYHLGAMQVIIKAIALILQTVTNATPIEAFAAAAHIFIGQVESSAALRPFLSDLTNSELHAVITGGFATVSGAIIAAYLEFGVPAEHVISASFMSAPAAIAIAKLSVPETRLSKLKTLRDIKLPTGQETNVIEALSVGAAAAIKMVAYVVVSVIAFVAVFAFLDAIVAYLGERVGYNGLSFQVICSYVFLPLAVVMGVPVHEARHVGNLIGKKLLTSELLAYSDLADLKEDGLLSEQSYVISTYILCGFSSILGLGVIIGAMTSAAPDRRQDVAKLCLRALVNGNIACFMTACIAGMLFQGDKVLLELEASSNSTYNTTTFLQGNDSLYSSVNLEPR